MASKDWKALECLAEGNEHSPAGSTGVNLSPGTLEGRASTVVCGVEHVGFSPVTLGNKQVSPQPSGGLVWALHSVWHMLLPWPDPDPGVQWEEDDWEGESTGAIFAPISLSS